MCRKCQVGLEIKLDYVELLRRRLAFSLWNSISSLVARTICVKTNVKNRVEIISDRNNSLWWNGLVYCVTFIHKKVF